MSNQYGYYNSRLKRGMKQKMYLLSAKYEQNNNNWNFQVKGTTNDYNLRINKEEMSCTCPDFTGRGRICKHLYFIVGRIGQNEDLIYQLEEDIEKGNRGSILSEDELKILSDNLSERLIQRITQINKKPNNEIVNTLNDDCSICFESLKNCSISQCVLVCKNYFHEECIDTWLNINTTCPLCRGKWTLKLENNTEYDPLDKLNIKQTKLK